MTEQEDTEWLRSALRVEHGTARLRKALHLLNELRSEELVVSLSDELARFLGPNYIGHHPRQALLILPTKRLEPLAGAWTDEFLDDFESELTGYWGLFDLLQAAGLSHSSHRVAVSAAQAQDEDLRRAGRDWLLELEDGIERR